ncbi:MAG: NYN domain-containing protein, partial [Gemmiger qucibialis]
LEPWYDFRLEVPQDCVGRAMADLQRRCAEFSTPENEDGLAVITGKAPVAEMRGCAREVTAYTRGAGRLSCMPRGYAPCHNTEAVLEAIGYQPDADTENPADSVFCSHGAGYLVKWDEVPAHAHVASGLGRNAPGAQQAKQEEADASDEASDARRRAAAYCGTLEQDKELLAIFERTYGPIKRRGEAAGQHDQLAARKAFRSVGPSQNRTPAAPPPSGPEYLLVDGYNVIFAWDELKKIAAENLDAARRRLMDILCNYAGYRKCVPILVFDAYRVKGAGREQETWHNLHVIYTREAETADMFIERATHELAKNHRVRVVSSDGAEQIIILGNGALRVSARAFEREVRAVEAEIREFLDQ